MLGRNYLNQTTLTLLNVSRNDSAMYRCIASSDLFKKASNELLINVQCKGFIFLQQQIAPTLFLDIVTF